MQFAFLASGLSWHDLLGSSGLAVHVTCYWTLTLANRQLSVMDGMVNLSKKIPCTVFHYVLNVV